jgi:hypothetical protein
MFYARLAPLSSTALVLTLAASSTTSFAQGDPHPELGGIWTNAALNCLTSSE